MAESVERAQEQARANQQRDGERDLHANQRPLHGMARRCLGAAARGESLRQATTCAFDRGIQAAEQGGE